MTADQTIVSRIMSEQQFPINQIPGRSGRNVNCVTAWRWVTKGLLTPDGRRVRLEAVKIGATWFTSREALERFAAARTPTFGGDGDAATPLPRTPAKRQRAAMQAEAELQRRGC
jgi:hypothetical protein